MSALHRRYTLRPLKSLGPWAIVVIGSDGYFSVVSDFGNYAFCWTHWGQHDNPEADFREWLSGCGPDYIASKLNGTRVFDGDATEKNIRRRLIQLRREGALSKEDARELWAELEDVDHDDSRCVGEWIQEHSDHLDHDLMEMTLNGEMKGFCAHIWPRLVSVLKKDVAACPKFITGNVEDRPQPAPAPPPAKPQLEGDPDL